MHKRNPSALRCSASATATLSLSLLYRHTVRQSAIDASTISRTASNRWIDISNNAHLRFPLPGPARPTPADVRRCQNHPSALAIAASWPLGEPGEAPARNASGLDRTGPRATSKSWPGARLAFPASPSGFFVFALLCCPVPVFVPAQTGTDSACSPRRSWRPDALPSHTNRT